MPFKQAISMFHQFRSSFHNVLVGRADNSGFIGIVAVSFMFVSCSVQTIVCLVDTDAVWLLLSLSHGCCVARHRNVDHSTNGIRTV